MHTEIDPRPPRPSASKRSRRFGRMLVTLTLLSGLAGGLWAVLAGMRLAEERKARMSPAPATPAPAR
jgi:hypothetical protein